MADFDLKEEKVKKKFILPNEKIEVRFIKKHKGMVVNPKHIAFGGKMEGCTTVLPANMLRNGNYVNVLTKEEKEYLEDKLGLGENGLSIYKKENNYWKNFKITLSKESIYLNTGDIEDFIKYKQLMSYTNKVCPNLKSLSHKGTYEYVIVRQEDESKMAVAKLNMTQEAFKLFGKIEDEKEQMIDYLNVSGIKVGSSISTLWLKEKIGEKVNTNPREFVETLKDPSYLTRVLIYKATVKGLIATKGNSYFTTAGVPLSENGNPATLDNAILYLEAPINQEFKIMLETKLKK